MVSVSLLSFSRRLSGRPAGQHPPGSGSSSVSANPGKRSNLHHLSKSGLFYFFARKVRSLVVDNVDNDDDGDDDDDDVDRQLQQRQQRHRQRQQRRRR